MKKLAFIWVVIFSLFFLINTSNVFAATGQDGPCDPTSDVKITPNHGCDDNLVCVQKEGKVITDGTCQKPASTIQIDKPKQGFASLGNAISNFFTIALVVAIILVLIMLIVGAYEWITSGGDKEAVAKARNRIINALIGLVVLAVAFALAKLAGQITGFPDIFNLVLPTPNPNAPGV